MDFVQSVHCHQENAIMNYQTTAPMPGDPDYPATQGAFPVWSKVYTRPSERTFVEITSHPEAKAKSAYTWVFIAGALSGLINSVTNFIVSLIVLRQTTDLPSGAGGALGAVGLLSALCTIPIAGAGAVAGFALSAGIVHITARFFGGQGSYDKLAYAFGAVTVPVTLVSAFLIPFNAFPPALFCTIPLLLAMGLYVMFLQVTAVKAVHQCGWGEAAAAYFLPSILILLLCGLSFVLLMRVAGPSINEFMQQLQQVTP
jgi:hypothetical protein